jgi:hypothetical protein
LNICKVALGRSCQKKIEKKPEEQIEQLTSWLWQEKQQGSLGVCPDLYRIQLIALASAVVAPFFFSLDDIPGIVASDYDDCNRLSLHTPACIPI